jgi:hypothetical protein
MIDQNKIFNYLKYAIGEIVLVGIGILNAFQVNEKTKYLVAATLVADFGHSAISPTATNPDNYRDAAKNHTKIKELNYQLTMFRDNNQSAFDFATNIKMDNNQLLVDIRNELNKLQL